MFELVASIFKGVVSLLASMIISLGIVNVPDETNLPIPPKKSIVVEQSSLIVATSSLLENITSPKPQEKLQTPKPETRTSEKQHAKPSTTPIPLTVNTLDWASINKALPGFNENLFVYYNSLTEIKAAQEKEKETNLKMQKQLLQTNDQNLRHQLLTLIQYDNAFIEAGDKLIALLTSYVQNYTGLVSAVQNKSENYYQIYIDKIADLDQIKISITNNYSAKQKTKQAYAQSLIQ